MSKVLDLINLGLLSPEENLIWYRAKAKLVYKARIQPDGTIVTADGAIHKTPSGAA